MLRVGIIDSGISEASGLPICNARSFAWTGDGITSSDNNIQDQLGHGSALAGIVKQPSAPTELFIARVFFEKLVCTPAQIAAALDWLVAEGARLINMSFGLHADRPILRDACQRALQAGAVLVAAAPARGEPVYPAAYPGIIRATGDARCDQAEISYLNSPQADFGGYVRANQASIAGASVGCAYIASALTNILLGQPDIDRTGLIDRLISQANYFGPENRSTTPMSHCYD